ncbi:hypothetical protein IX39_19145 [Chryseobacterium formosense]|uniref:YD repeat-containing protein n=2 Tax=Chryseobacterium formosense TaxID=236814 RepID=A0A085YYZ8_9FLAO|nr:hypothetical protein IX39_19145 [Chryseobacterium formosense]
MPQSPGVSSLMKFEEVPVSLYTGIPDVNIPIGDFNTNSSKLNLKVSLNYHPLSAKVDDVASEYGLGWSLFAGGMISRTIRDLPDESTHSDQKYGMYYNTIADKENNFNIVKNYLLNGTGSGLNSEKAKRQIFESVLFNRFDNSYDMYQYNFMGYTGRFFIKKDETTGQLQLVKLDKNNLKINFFFNSEKSPVKFEIIDDKGLRFVFDVIEKSSRSYLINSINSGNVNTNESLDYHNLNTGFYLGEVYEDTKQLLKFSYGSIETAQSTAISKKRGQQYPYDTNLVGSPCYDDIVATFPANDETSIFLNTTGTRFIDSIQVTDRAKIYFEYAGNRLDSNLALPNNHQKLTKITTKDYYGNIILKQFNLVYSYSMNIESKMVLSAVNVLDKNLQNEYSYGLSYGGNGKKLIFGSDDVRADLWGHYRCVQNTRVLDMLSPKLMYEPSPNCVEKDVLTKMTLPTSGEIRYNYELNTYNYKPHLTTVSQEPTANPIEEVTDYSSNLKNWEIFSSSIIINNFGQSAMHFFTITEPQEVTFNSGGGAYTSEPWALNFYKLNESTGQMEYANIHPLGPIVDVDPNYITWQKRNFPAGKYYAVLSTVSGNMPNNPIPTNFTAGFMAYYAKQNPTENFLYGGGIRIKEVAFLNNASSVQKKKLYEYNDIANNSKSSGALVFPVPVLQYEEYYNNYYMCISTFGAVLANNLEMTYNTISTKNLLSPEKTKGADVGYKYITVKDIDYTNTNAVVSKGRTLHEFSSPIDKPNSLFSYLSMSPPGAYAYNFDYRRGNLLNKKVFDAGNNMVYQENNVYDDNFTTEISGINFLARNNFIFNRFNTSDVDTYAAFKTTMDNCNVNSLYHLCRYTSAMGINVNPLSFIYYYFSKEIVGKTNLISSVKTEYFPNGKTLVTNESYEYNTLDYLKKSSILSSDNILNETLYRYGSDINPFLNDKNIVSIPLEIETKKNGKTISKTETFYPVSQSDADGKTSGFPLPYKVDATDFKNTVSTEVTYDLYDSKGNVQQYTTKDGIPTTIIWGYNKTQPIAKVVGSDLDSIDNALISSIVTPSDQDAANPSAELALITALENFRKNNSLSGYQITTYTYDPLIGVTSITPPSGIREVYLYDAANRLKEIRENSASGKILKEFKYNYKQ